MIRPMQPSDVPRVAEIRVFGWRCAYRGIISDEYLFKTLLVSDRIEKINSDLIGKEDRRYVYDDGIIKAFLSIGPCGDEDKPGVFELYAIYVDPCLQGQGVGAALAVHCEAEAAKRGYKEICLWTFEKNVSARAFYEKLGYKLDGATQIVEPFGATGVRYHKYINKPRGS